MRCMWEMNPCPEQPHPGAFAEAPPDESSEAREVGPTIASARRAATQIECQVLDCTDQRPLTVQWLVLPDGRAKLESFQTDPTDASSTRGTQARRTQSRLAIAREHHSRVVR